MNTQRTSIFIHRLLDNIIDVDNEVRIIDVLVESINIEEFGFAIKLK